MINKFPAGLLLIFLCATGCREEKNKDTEVIAPKENHSQDSGIKEKGVAIAGETQQALGGILKAKIAETGPEGAVVFCNINALPITDSIAKAKGVGIKRVTDKPRNTVNRATGQELSIISDFRSALKNGSPTEPMLVREKGQVQVYVPITTKELCLQCHGVPGSDISEMTLSRILERYPADQATGYEAGELRGLWNITFKE